MNNCEFQTSLFKNLSPNLTLEDIFYQYDFWEEYDPIKNYEKTIYSRKFKNKIRNYINVLCLVTFQNNEQKYFILSERYKSPNEKLIPYCPCFKCSCSKLNPLKYVFCECCVGCIKSGEFFSNKDYISIAKKNLETKKKFNKIRIYEITFLVCVSLLLYSI